eukprot:g50701.t1
MRQVPDDQRQGGQVESRANTHNSPARCVTEALQESFEKWRGPDAWHPPNTKVSRQKFEGACGKTAQIIAVTAPEQPQLKSSGPQEIDWDGSDITPSNGKKHLNEIMAEMRKLHPAHEIEPQPVYLGFIKPLTNTKHFMTRAQVRAWVLAHRSSLYFCDYFDKNGVRKVPFHIDHIIPDSLGGADHPRNYALMPEIFNQRFASWWMPAKAQYISTSSLALPQHDRLSFLPSDEEDADSAAARVELEATLGKEVLGEDLHLYTLEEPEGLVQIDTPEFEMRVKSLRLVRDNNSDAIRFFEERGIPSKYLLR